MDTFFDICFMILGFRFESILGPILELKSAMMRQDGSKKELTSLKVPKSSICKKFGFLMGKPYFVSLGGSRDEHKMLKTALKRHLKGFETQKIRGSKLDLKSSSFWTSFGADLGSKLEPKIDKTGIKNRTKKSEKCCLCAREALRKVSKG